MWTNEEKPTLAEFNGHHGTGWLDWDDKSVWILYLVGDHLAKVRYRDGVESIIDWRSLWCDCQVGQLHLRRAFVLVLFRDGAKREVMITSGADLRGACLSGADLRGAYLYGACLSGAYLYGAKNVPKYAECMTAVCPEGDIVAWKKLSGGVIAQLLVSSLAKRSNATSRKCRAQFVHVTALFSPDGKELPQDTVGKSMRDGKTEYQVGKTVTCDKWDEDRWNECSGGIHFFITRGEAEEWQG